MAILPSMGSKGGKCCQIFGWNYLNFSSPGGKIMWLHVPENETIEQAFLSSLKISAFYHLKTEFTYS
nr:hypothetical protein [uncultured Desulfobacter sp.]